MSILGQLKYQVKYGGICAITALMITGTAHAGVPTNDGVGNSIRNAISAVNQQISSIMSTVKGTVDGIMEQNEFLKGINEAREEFDNFTGDLNEFMDDNAGLALIINGVTQAACGGLEPPIPKFNANFSFPFPSLNTPDGICDAISQISDAAGLPDYTEGFYGRLGDYNLAEDYSLNTMFSDLNQGLDFGDGCLRDSFGVVMGARVDFGSNYQTIAAQNSTNGGFQQGDPVNCNEIIGSDAKLDLVAVTERELNELQDKIAEKTLTLTEQQKVRDNWEKERVVATVDCQSLAANMRAKAREEAAHIQSIATTVPSLDQTGEAMQMNSAMMTSMARIQAYRLELEAACDGEMASKNVIATTFKPTYDPIYTKAIQSARLATPEEREKIREYRKKKELLARGLGEETLQQRLVRATTGSVKVKAE